MYIETKMKVLIVFSAVCAVALGGVLPIFDDRIVGGKVTTIEEHPYQISLRVHDQQNCGGSILNEDTILTTANCVHGYDYEAITVRVGATVHYEGEEFEVAKIMEHEDFLVGADNNNDIAVLKLARPLTFNDRVQPISLQPEDTPVPEGAEALVTGWGTTIAGVPMTNDELVVASVRVMTNERCVKSYDSATITGNMLCAGALSTDACQGDGGGPLVSKGKLIGLVSWGYGCADPKYPGVYANVSALHEFATRYM